MRLLLRLRKKQAEIFKIIAKQHMVYNESKYQVILQEKFCKKSLLL